MLFDWSRTTTVVAFCGRNETVRGRRSAARQTAAAGIAPRRRLGRRAASSDAVTVRPPLEVAAHLRGERSGAVASRRRLGPRQLLRRAGEAAVAARPQLLREELERLPPLPPPLRALHRRERPLERR